MQERKGRKSEGGKQRTGGEKEERERKTKERERERRERAKVHAKICASSSSTHAIVDPPSVLEFDFEFLFEFAVFDHVLKLVVAQLSILVLVALNDGTIDELLQLHVIQI